MRVYVIGHTGAGLTATCASACNHNSIVVTSTTTINASSSQFNNNELLITKTLNNIDYGDYELFSKLDEIKEMKAGWLKPHKQLIPFNNNSKINYNLPRSRLGEKKQIFLKAAA